MPCEGGTSHSEPTSSSNPILHPEDGEQKLICFIRHKPHAGRVSLPASRSLASNSSAVYTPATKGMPSDFWKGSAFI